MTRAELDTMIKSFELPKAPFASGGTFNDPADNTASDGVAINANKMSYWFGLPDIYAKAYSEGGKKLLRSDFNGIGSIGTRELALRSCGGYHTFNANVAAIIGGYPLGAILDWYQPSTGWMRKVRCIKSGGNCMTPIDDATHGVETSDAYWQIVDVKDEQLKYTTQALQYSGNKVSFSSSSNGYTITMPFNGLLTITRTSSSDNPSTPFGRDWDSGMNITVFEKTVKCPYVTKFTLRKNTTLTISNKMYSEVTGTTQDVTFNAVAKEVI